MARSLLVFVLIIAYCSAFGQNWQTVRSGDTNYFTAGKHASYKSWVYYPQEAPPMMDSPILRMAYVAGLSELDGDSVFSFYTSLRDSSDFGGCVDTAGVSWLGPMCIRKADGTEYYFNRYRDTITLLTHAGPGYSWVLAKDTSGLQFIGHVIQLGVMQIDGSPDSFKSISIQAYSGTVPVAHPYNALILQISKTHGWIKALDLYRFPNIFSGKGKGIVIDGTQHSRLPLAATKGCMLERIDWKYVPGNEWIWKWEGRFSFNPDNTPQYLTVRHDSVLSFLPLASGLGLATIRSVEFKSSRIYVSGQNAHYNSAFDVSVSVHTDTVRDETANPVPVKVENDWRHSSYYRYFAWPYDTAHYFFTRAVLAHFETHPAFDKGCMRFLPFSAVGDWDQFDTYLPDFGQTGKYVVDMDDHSGNIIKAEYGRYIYIKTGSSIFGTKVNVAALNVPSVLPGLLFKVTPNPAVDHITISSEAYPQPAHAALFNIAGQCVRRLSFSEKLVMPADDIAEGLYFLEITSGGIRETSKVLIQH
jgi:hypothetical protein